jgi:hypothetical protein
MNDEPPQINEPEPGKTRIPGIVWVFVTLSPTFLIMTLSPTQNAIQVVGFGLNPLVTFISCFALFNRPGRSKAVPIVAGIFLGAFFALLNALIGALAGCAIHGNGF